MIKLTASVIFLLYGLCLRCMDTENLSEARDVQLPNPTPPSDASQQLRSMLLLNKNLATEIINFLSKPISTDDYYGFEDAYVQLTQLADLLDPRKNALDIPVLRLIIKYDLFAALDYLIKKNFFLEKSVVAYVVYYGAPTFFCAPLHEAVKAGRQSIARSLLTFGHVDTYDIHGIAPLHRAVLNGDAAMVKLLLDSAALIQLSLPLKVGPRCTALHLAVLGGREDIVDLLLQAIRKKLERHPDSVSQLRSSLLDAQDDGGNTPLHFAVYCHHDSIALALQQAGARLLVGNKVVDLSRYHR